MVDELSKLRRPSLEYPQSLPLDQNQILEHRVGQHLVQGLFGNAHRLHGVRWEPPSREEGKRRLGGPTEVFRQVRAQPVLIRSTGPVLHEVHALAVLLIGE